MPSARTPKPAHFGIFLIGQQTMLGVVALLLSGLGFIGFSLAILIEPVQVMAAADVSLSSAAEIAEIRAFYGGLGLALGLLMLAWLGKRRRKDGLLLAAVCYGGIASARIAAMVHGSVSTNFLKLALAIELVLTALALIAWSREGKKPSIF